MVWHFGKVYEGYLTLATAPLPRHYLEKIPIADQVNGAGFRPDEVANLPVPGPFKFDTVTPAGRASPRAQRQLRRCDRPARPPTSTAVVFKWYGDPDAMIAGFRNGEIDVAFDLPGLRPPEGPGPRRPGDAPSRPSCTSSCARTGRRTTDFDERPRAPVAARATPAVQDRGAGCPTADPAIREAIAYAIDKNEINTRLLGGNAQVANTNISPCGLVLRGPDPGDLRPREGQADPRRRRLGGLGWRRHRREGRHRRPRSSSAPRPARSARTRWPSSARG